MFFSYNAGIEKNVKIETNAIKNIKKALLLGSNFDFLIFYTKGLILLKFLSIESFIDKNCFLSFFANLLSLLIIV